MTTLKDYITTARVKMPKFDRKFKNNIQQETFEGESVGYTTTPASMEETMTCGVDESVCYAKKLKTENGVVRYYVKTDSQGHLFDPWGSRSEGTQNKFESTVGQNKWTFKEVKIKAFDYYLMFLKSKNHAWKLNAEREHRNG